MAIRLDLEDRAPVVVRLRRYGSARLKKNADLRTEPRGATLLTLDRLAYDDLDRPVVWGRHVYRAEMYDFSWTLISF